jgi:uncharacterized lipoprotein YddW (UPF0748 family)
MRAPLTVVLVGLATLASARTAPVPSGETRALWVLRSSLASPAAIDALVSSARTYGFNTLLVQVRGRGDAYYASRLEPRAEELQAQPPDFDPFDRVLSAGRAAGLKVHAWVNINLVASAWDLPAAPSHLVYTHPEWLMVPRPLAREMAAVEPASPAYLGRLARWVRAQNGDLEGLYLSPLQPDAAAHLAAVVDDLVARYPVDGVHFDYIRFPDDRFDFSRHAVEAFRGDVAPGLTPDARRELDAQAESDPLAYPAALPDEWNRFRRSQLSALVMRLRTAVRSRRPDALVSAAVAPDVEEAYARRLQDWRTWLESGLIDAVCPMAYTPDAPLFARQIAAARGLAGHRAVWAGVGAYRLSPAQTVQHVQIAREQGADGFVLFSYDSMTGAERAQEPYLAQVSRALFAPAGGSK